MGLDLAVGGLVLLAAIRGWLKGFLVQSIRLGGLVASVYAALPVRDQVKPYVVENLRSIRPELVDRMLWWASAAVSYIVIVGVASLAVSVSRRKTFGIAEPQRGDQFAGLGLGLLKGLVVASFLVASLQKYAEPHLAKIAWADEQIKTSIAWDWNTRYQPAAQIWAVPPVQRFVNHIQTMGLMSPSGQTKDEPEKPVQTASRTPGLTLPPSRQYQVPPPPRRRKLALRKPFEEAHLKSKSGRRETTEPQSLQELDDAPKGLDIDMIRTIESLKGHSPFSSALPNFEDD